jgi:hypothetical protein
VKGGRDIGRRVERGCAGAWLCCSVGRGLFVMADGWILAILCTVG